MKNMSKKTKLLAMYLPQYHETPENNAFWGQGFTDWVSVKKAEPLFEGHAQPKTPLNNNYYDLSDPDTLRWQATTAERYGIDGFCFYHYWFENDKPVLDTPAQNLLKHKDINMPFCFAWDNTSWVRSWSKFSGNAWAPKYDPTNYDEQGREYLLKLDYGEKEQWQSHFEYLLPFFQDPRYIKKDGKPVFIFFSTFGAKQLREMEGYWRILAQKHGFEDIYLISRCDPIIRKKMMNAEFVYQPISSGWQKKQVIYKYLNNYMKIDIPKSQLQIYDYDTIWKKIIKNAKRNRNKNIYFGAFVNYDDTPRRGVGGRIVQGGTPQKFESYLRKLMEISYSSGKDYIFITAWNEWGEGAYLEPDVQNGYEYLEAVKRIVLER